jgi:hypothetical protein
LIRRIITKHSAVLHCSPKASCAARNPQGHPGKKCG